jgi:hypothetical protein
MQHPGIKDKNTYSLFRGVTGEWGVKNYYSK